MVYGGDHDGQTIPLDEDAISEDAMHILVEWAHGRAEREIQERRADDDE